MPCIYTLVLSSTHHNLCYSFDEIEYTLVDFKKKSSKDEFLISFGSEFHSFSEFLIFLQDFSLDKCVSESYFSYFSTKTYVVGTQKHSKHMLKLMGKNIYNFTLKNCGYLNIQTSKVSFLIWVVFA